PAPVMTATLPSKSPIAHLSLPQPTGVSSVASGGEHRERLPAPNRRSRRELGVRAVNFPLGEALQDLLKRYPPFEPRQRRAKAEVGAVAEGEVLADLPMDVKPVTVRVSTVIAVGRPDQKQHDAALRHRLTLDLDVACHVPAYVRRRRLVAENLL